MLQTIFQPPSSPNLKSLTWSVLLKLLDIKTDEYYSYDDDFSRILGSFSPKNHSLMCQSSDKLSTL